MTKKYLRAVQARFSRRRAIQAIGALVGGATLGCSDDGSSASATDGTPGTSTTTGDGTSTTTDSGDPTTSGAPTTGGGGTDSDATTGSSTSTGDPDTSSSTGDATTTEGTTGEPVDECAASDLTPEELLAPIEHIVVLMMENRSFDHYFGALKLVEGQAVDGLTGSESNPTISLGDITVFEMDEFQPQDPPHNWDECHNQFNLGENNGFAFENEKKNPDHIEQVMGYHIREHIPVLYGLADNFALCERWFASVMGPTWPNRYYLNACSSNGGKSNFPDPFITSLWHRCDDAGITSKIYFTDVPWVAGAFPFVPTVWSKLSDGGGFDINNLTNPNDLERFFEDVAAGQLPNFTCIDPGFTSNDDHPDHDITLGQILIGSIYKALAESPLWSKTLLIITYDEHGGFYDHVPPPKTVDKLSEFQQLGFRVPTLVIGPHVRKGCVIETQFEHCSVGATLMRRFGLEPLNERMATANDVSSCINPAYLSDPQPPPPVPLVDVSVGEITARVGRSTSQTELFSQLGVKLDENFRQKVVAATMRLLRRAEKLGVARLRP